MRVSGANKKPVARNSAERRAAGAKHHIPFGYTRILLFFIHSKMDNIHNANDLGFSRHAKPETALRACRREAP
jgi:hypothetical protein